MDKADLLIAQDPDSALSLLETIKYPKGLKEEAFNRYSLLYIQARDKCMQDISKDTLFQNVDDYYLKKGDMDKASLAEFYSGRILHVQKRHSEAMIKYKDAEQHAESTKDENLKGMIRIWIGNLYFDQLYPDDAISWYKQANQYFSRIGMYKNEMVTNNKLGTAFLVKNNIDSSISYYNKSLALAEQQKDIFSQVSAIKNIGIAYENIGDVKQARDYYRKALTLSGEKELMAKTYLSIAYSFNAEKQRDSTLFYIEKAQSLVENTNPAQMLVIYQMLSDIEQNAGNYLAALNYQKDYTKELYDDLTKRNNQAIVDVQEKYNFELIENENNRLFIQRQTFILIVLILVIALLIGMFVFYRKMSKNKSDLQKANTYIAQLKEMAEEYKDEQQSNKKVILQHFHVLKKVALLDKHLNGEEKKQGSKLLKRFNEIVYDQEVFDWDRMFDTMKHAFDNLPENLRLLYPSLDESEIRICCLTYGELNNTDISMIMNLSVNTIQSKKSTIRKKLGIEGYGNIKDFLKQKMKEMREK
ncbi:MAG: tetratricopeptide repeat protein [Dysgonomonas sp.]|nr:tetratricopeptide repeat protein [Dysgonomonas sp.]